MMSQLPVLLDTFEECSPQAQCNTLRVVFQVIDVLDQTLLSFKVLPIIRLVVEDNYELQVQEEALKCLEKLVNYLSKSEILDDVLPALTMTRLEEPTILLSVARIYRHMLTDKARYGLTIGLLATTVLPIIIPYLVSPDLKEGEFRFMSNLIQDMLDVVIKGQSAKLKLEKVSSLDKLNQLTVTVDTPTSTNRTFQGLNGLPSFSVPSEQSSSCSGRKSSLFAENVTKLMKATSQDSSPDVESESESSCFLKVMENSTKPRRHSDNAIIVTTSLSPTTSPTPPLTRGPNASYITRARSSSSLINGSPRRRHSAMNTSEIQKYATKVLGSARDSVAGGFEQATKATKGMNFAFEGISGTMSPTASSSRQSSRRCSVAGILSAAQAGSLLSQHQEAKNVKKGGKNPSKKLFKKIGSEINNLLK